MVLTNTRNVILAFIIFIFPCAALAETPQGCKKSIEIIQSALEKTPSKEAAELLLLVKEKLRYIKSSMTNSEIQTGGCRKSVGEIMDSKQVRIALRNPKVKTKILNAVDNSNLDPETKLKIIDLIK